MQNWAHIGETALLILAAYLIGCALGYGGHRLLHAGRRQSAALPALAPAPPPTQPELRRIRSPAARLAASVEDMPTVPSVVSVAIAGLPAPLAASETMPPPPKPQQGDGDKLRKIKGIGPKIESSLHALGVFHLVDIAGWTDADIERIDAHLAFKGRIRRERWVEQARDLIKTDEPG
jgi:predicted flap endonuclease-1-like 5' DNA nuclease